MIDHVQTLFLTASIRDQSFLSIAPRSTTISGPGVVENLVDCPVVALIFRRPAFGCMCNYPGIHKLGDVKLCGKMLIGFFPAWPTNWLNKGFDESLNHGWLMTTENSVHESIEGGLPAMTFIARKIFDYFRGIAVVGLFSLLMLFIHVMFPKHGETGLLTPFGSVFWISWLTLMGVFAIVYFVWVFFIFEYNLTERRYRYLRQTRQPRFGREK